MPNKRYAGIDWPIQADYFSPDDKVFEIVKMNKRWYVCQCHVPLENEGGYLAVFDHFPTWDEVMAKCWK